MSSERHETVVDFVAKGDSPDQWKMVLVEEGPWPGSIDDQLQRIQERMYDCIDAALDGKLAKRFPEAKGKNMVVQLDCYNVPKEEVKEFFDRFSKGVLVIDEYREALKQNQFVKNISFEVNFDSIH